MERAEYLACILDATQRLSALPLAYVGTAKEWESAVLTAGCATAFFKRYEEANEENVTDFLAFSTANSSSIRNCFEIARSVSAKLTWCTILFENRSRESVSGAATLPDTGPPL